jgi:hypothetical protein
MKFIAQDATFNLPQIADANKDRADVSLAEGHSIYPHEDEEYGPFMARQGPGNDVSNVQCIIKCELTCIKQTSTCSNLKAVKLQSAKKFKNLSKSGVASVQCPRHFIVHFFTDLTAGEK